MYYRVQEPTATPGHLITGMGREEVMRKGGGEEARGVRCMRDMCSEMWR